MVAGNTNVWEWVWCDKGSSANETHWQEYRNGYQQYSILLVQRDHPDWSREKCEAEAKTQFVSCMMGPVLCCSKDSKRWSCGQEAAATHWLVSVLETVKPLAPKCHWGYFAGPSICHPYGPCVRGADGEMLCGYDHPTAGPPLRALAAKQRPVQEAATGLFPALYAVPSCVAGTTWEREGCVAAQPNCTVAADMEGPAFHQTQVFVNQNCTLECGCCGLPNSSLTETYTTCGYDEAVPDRSIETDRAWIKSVVGQAVRATNNTVPVIPYIWPFCEGGPCYQDKTAPFANNGSKHVSDAMIQAMIEVPYSAGAAAALFWIDRESVRPSDGLVALTETSTGPHTKAFLARVESCSKANCSGHGRCMPVESDDCECAPGWSGARCDQQQSAQSMETPIEKEDSTCCASSPLPPS